MTFNSKGSSVELGNSSKFAVRKSKIYYVDSGATYIRTFDVDTLDAGKIGGFGTEEEAIAEIHMAAASKDALLILFRNGQISNYDLEKHEISQQITFGEQCRLDSLDFEYVHAFLAQDCSSCVVGGFNPYQNFLHVKLIDLRKGRTLATKYISLEGGQSRNR